MSASGFGPKAKFNARKDPFGLSLSKPSCLMPKASTGSAWPFDKLRANGGGEHVNANGSGDLTVVNSRSGPKAEPRFMR